jgi:hypothetical protein
MDLPRHIYMAEWGLCVACSLVLRGNECGWNTRETVRGMLQNLPATKSTSGANSAAIKSPTKG